jgi:aminoglycoside/choline kinase family phosphotransferase
MSNIQNSLLQLFKNWASEKADSIHVLTPSGSERKYYRIKSKNKNAIGVYHSNDADNNAFISFSETFNILDFNTPHILSSDLKNHIYLISDLGDQDLFSLVQNEPSSLSEETKDLYKKSLEHLFKFQTESVKHLDFSKCTPRAKLDKQSLLWDLSYFKYYFLKLKNIHFDEQKLENDFNTFVDYLMQADQDYFVYRDFQSRNIMINNGEPYFIDYQGGRRGPLQYDVASLLFQVRANLSTNDRQELLEYYLNIISQNQNINIQSFQKYFHPYVLIRICQVLGAYGYRGLIEKKAHFIKSIPFAISTLKWLLNELQMDLQIPELLNSLKEVAQLEINAETKTTKGLTIHLNSFAYKHGIPADYSGHGEGFVFDCRFLPNPGRLESYKHLSGLNKEVQDYLMEQEEVNIFLERVKELIKPAVQKYQDRNFSDLSINFGCTGGQHRSVFMTESINHFLKNNFNLNIELKHTQKKNWLTS